MGPAGRLTGGVIATQGLPPLPCQVFSPHTSFLSLSLILSLPVMFPFRLIPLTLFLTPTLTHFYSCLSRFLNPQHLIDRSGPGHHMRCIRLQSVFTSLSLFALFILSLHISGQIYSVCLCVIYRLGWIKCLMLASLMLEHCSV